MATPALSPSPGPEPNDSKKNVPRRLVRLSERIETTCYWLTMTTLAIATVYLGYVAISNAPPPAAADLGWGASTPTWMIDCLPLFVTGICLAEAGYSLWQGVRCWKRIFVGVDSWSCAL